MAWSPLPPHPSQPATPYGSVRRGPAPGSPRSWSSTAGRRTWPRRAPGLVIFPLSHICLSGCGANSPKYNPSPGSDFGIQAVTSQITYPARLQVGEKNTPPGVIGLACIRTCAGEFPQRRSGARCLPGRRNLSGRKLTLWTTSGTGPLRRRSSVRAAGRGQAWHPAPCAGVVPLCIVKQFSPCLAGIVSSF